MLELAEKKEPEHYLILVTMAAIGLSVGEVVGNKDRKQTMTISQFLRTKTKAEGSARGEIVKRLLAHPKDRVEYDGTTYFLSGENKLVNRVLPEDRLPGLQAENLREDSILVQGKGRVLKTTPIPAWLHSRYKSWLVGRNKGRVFNVNSDKVYYHFKKYAEAAEVPYTPNTNELRTFYESHKGILPDALAPGFTVEYVGKIIEERKEQEEIEQKIRATDGPPTPREALDQAYRTLTTMLYRDILDRLKKGTPKFFEHAVLDFLVAMKLGPRELAEVVGRTGDGGIDGIINQDKLGLDRVYFQAKRWDATVGSRDVRDFAGSLDEKKAKKSVFVTTSQFSKDAQEFVRNIEKNIVLVDGKNLAQSMADYDVGVEVDKTYVVKKVKDDYFERSL